MKRNVIAMVTAIVLSVLFCLMTPAYASTVDHSNLPTVVKFETVTSTDNVTLEDVKNVVVQNVPEDYVEAFCHFTECDNDVDTMNLMIQILAIGKWESGWKVIASPKNANGSYDIGYLALNSYNIENKYFMSRFGPKDYEFIDDTELYLATCINFYKYLYSRYGEDAAYCYNCGENRYIKKTMPRKTIIYKIRVGEYVGKYVSDSKKCAEDRIKLEEAVKSTRYNRSAITRVEDSDFSYVSKEILKLKHRQFKSRIIVAYYTTEAINEQKIRKHIAATLLKVKMPNPEYIYIGYVRKYGNHKAPVFQSVITGEKIIVESV